MPQSHEDIHCVTASVPKEAPAPGVGMICARLGEQEGLVKELLDRLSVLHETLYGVPRDGDTGGTLLRAGFVPETDDRLQLTNSKLYDAVREVNLLIDKLICN